MMGYDCAMIRYVYCFEDMIKTNDVAFKDAYRRACNLLTSDEICNIRTKYGISQADLAKLLGRS